MTPQLRIYQGNDILWQGDGNYTFSQSMLVWVQVVKENEVELAKKNHYPVKFIRIEDTKEGKFSNGNLY